MIYQFENSRVQAEGDYFIAENASVIGSVTLKANTSVWFSAVIRGDIEPIIIGEGSNVQDCAVLHTDAGFPVTVGEKCTIGHQAMLHGCTIDANSLIGINAVILNGAHIGKNCIVGASALITEGKEIPDGSLVVGSPGKVVRQLSEEQIQTITDNANRYMNNLKRYKAGLLVQENVDKQ